MTPNDLLIDAMFYIEAGIRAEEVPIADRDMHFIAAHSLVERAREMLCGFDVTPYQPSIAEFMAGFESALLIERMKRP